MEREGNQALRFVQCKVKRAICNCCVVVLFSTVGCNSQCLQLGGEVTGPGGSGKCEALPYVNSLDLFALCSNGR